MQEPALFAIPERVDSAQDCYFYHVMDIPGHGVVGGEWDLRDGVKDYLGGVDLSGERVLEIGPASGFLTFQMESAGAEVVSVELAPDTEWDFVPLAGVDFAPIRAQRVDHMRRLRRGYWYAHGRFASSARVHYGSVYSLPEGLGRFDTGLLGCVLLHLRDPLGALNACARRCNQIIVTEVHDSALDGRPVRAAPPEHGRAAVGHVVEPRPGPPGAVPGSDRIRGRGRELPLADLSRPAGPGSDPDGDRRSQPEATGAGHVASRWWRGA